VPRRRFEHEVRAYLRRHGVKGEELDRTVARLAELDMVSDAQTVRAWLRDRLRFAPKGRVAFRAELLKRGVAAPVVDDALAELCPPEAEADTAEDVLRRSRTKLVRLPEAVGRRRAWGTLARRGFDPSTCREAIARVFENAWTREEER
jgi:SOS response regulatory protein OraA/RecX